MGPQPEHVRAYVFRVKRGVLAIAWSRADEPVPVAVSDGVTVIDIMGNVLHAREIELTATPVYLLSGELAPRAMKAMIAGK